MTQQPLGEAGSHGAGAQQRNPGKGGGAVRRSRGAAVVEAV